MSNHYQYHLRNILLCLFAVVFLMGCFWQYPEPDYGHDYNYNYESHEYEGEYSHDYEDHGHEDEYEGEYTYEAPDENALNSQGPLFGLPVTITPYPTLDYNTIYDVGDVTGKWFGMAALADGTFLGSYNLTLNQYGVSIAGASDSMFEGKEGLFYVEGTYDEGRIVLTETRIQTAKDYWDQSCLWTLDMRVIQGVRGPTVVGTFEAIPSNSDTCAFSSGEVRFLPLHGQPAP